MQLFGQKLEQSAEIIVWILAIVGIVTGSLALAFPEFSIWLGEAMGWCADLLIGG